MSVPGTGNANAAGVRPSSFEASELAATAQALPPDWLVQIESGGQLAITPRDGAPYFTACWVADPARRVVRRQPWRSPYVERASGQLTRGVRSAS
jgi:hypothetical protein